MMARWQRRFSSRVTTTLLVVALLGGVASRLHVHGSDGSPSEVACGHSHPERDGPTLASGDPCGICIVAMAATSSASFAPLALLRRDTRVADPLVAPSALRAVAPRSPCSIRGPPTRV